MVLCRYGFVSMCRVKVSPFRRKTPPDARENTSRAHVLVWLWLVPGSHDHWRRSSAAALKANVYGYSPAVRGWNVEPFRDRKCPHQIPSVQEQGAASIAPSVSATFAVYSHLRCCFRWVQSLPQCENIAVTAPTDRSKLSNNLYLISPTPLALLKYVPASRCHGSPID